MNLIAKRASRHPNTRRYTKLRYKRGPGTGLLHPGRMVELRHNKLSNNRARTFESMLCGGSSIRRENVRPVPGPVCPSTRGLVLSLRRFSRQTWYDNSFQASQTSSRIALSIHRRWVPIKWTFPVESNIAALIYRPCGWRVGGHIAFLFNQLRSHTKFLARAASITWLWSYIIQQVAAIRERGGGDRRP